MMKVPQKIRKNKSKICCGKNSFVNYEWYPDGKNIPKLSEI